MIGTSVMKMETINLNLIIQIVHIQWFNIIHGKYKYLVKKMIYH